jgi:hypothetical protein
MTPTIKGYYAIIAAIFIAFVLGFMAASPKHRPPPDHIDWKAVAALDHSLDIHIRGDGFRCSECDAYFPGRAVCVFVPHRRYPSSKYGVCVKCAPKQ